MTIWVTVLGFGLVLAGLALLLRRGGSFADLFDALDIETALHRISPLGFALVAVGIVLIAGSQLL